MKNAALLLTHELNSRTEELFDRIQSAFGQFGDTWLLLHDEKKSFSTSLNSFRFDYTEIKNLGFRMIADTLIPGSNHFPLILFKRQHPEYTGFWVIEYDVHFNGDWTPLFDRYSADKADFCSCHIRTYQEEPLWHWWLLDHRTEHVPLPERLRSFNPIYKISARALEAVDTWLRNGWLGHHEVLLPTLLHKHDFKVLDFGGDGSFVAAGFQNSFYTSRSFSLAGEIGAGSMRYRPVISDSEFNQRGNLLYHPRK